VRCGGSKEKPRDSLKAKYEEEQRGAPKDFSALGEAHVLCCWFLRSRGVEVSAELEQRIMACSDPALLAAWLQRVATVTSAAELLAG
jgi:hypothetical protein